MLLHLSLACKKCKNFLSAPGKFLSAPVKLRKRWGAKEFIWESKKILFITPLIYSRMICWKSNFPITLPVSPLVGKSRKFHFHAPTYICPLSLSRLQDYGRLDDCLKDLQLINTKTDKDHQNIRHNQRHFMIKHRRIYLHNRPFRCSLGSWFWGGNL